MKRGSSSFVLSVALFFFGSHATAQDVDLLHATPTDLAVSSAYRNRSSQIGLLVDGDLETAWNSRTGDLVGAWIEVRLPPDATVTGIALTAGFTHQTARSDLFTGNHRVSRVRVSRDGAVIGEHSLDVASRELQTLPVRGGGGVYRVEVVGVEPGSRRDWREICISELRVLGRAPGMAAGQHFPRLASGSLPDPRPAPGAADPAELSRRARSAIDAFARAWSSFEDDQRGVAATSEGPRTASDVPLATYRATRRRELGRVAELAELVDAAIAGQLRATAARQADWGARGWTGAMENGDLDRVDEAMRAVLARASDDAVRCRWARAHAGLRIARIGWRLEHENYATEMNEFYDPDTLSAADRRASREVERAWERWQSFAWRWPREATTVTRELARFTYPSSLPQDDWTALRAQLDAAAQSCR